MLKLRVGPSQGDGKRTTGQSEELFAKFAAGKFSRFLLQAVMDHPMFAFEPYEFRPCCANDWTIRRLCKPYEEANVCADYKREWLDSSGFDGRDDSILKLIFVGEMCCESWQDVCNVYRQRGLRPASVRELMFFYYNYSNILPARFCLVASGSIDINKQMYRATVCLDGWKPWITVFKCDADAPMSSSHLPACLLGAIPQEGDSAW
jgi:hypothetical protein